MIIKDREELEIRLRELSETEYSGKLNWGAMCYEISMPQPTDYLCPVCGSITSESGFIVREIEEARKTVLEIRNLGYDAHLDEREFCATCNENDNVDHEIDRGEMPIDEFIDIMKELDIKNPELVFKFRFESDSEYHTARSTIAETYRCVLEFLNGKDHYINDRDGTEPIHDNIHILQKMLGIGLDLPVPDKRKLYWADEDEDDVDDNPKD